MDIVNSAATLGLALGLFVDSGAEASYPVKPVRFIVVSSAGGSDDFHARLIGQKLTAFVAAAAVDQGGRPR